MKLRDAVWGVLLLALAGVLFVHMRAFPAMPGQKIGPAALPTLLAIGLAVCGAIMLVNDLRTSRSQPWVEWPEWIAARPQVIATRTRGRLAGRPRSVGESEVRTRWPR